MGSESTVDLTAGDGSIILHAWQRTIGSTAKQEQVFVGAPGWLPTYTAIARGVRANTANSHLLIIQGDGTNRVRLRRLSVRPANIASAASTLDIRVLRTTTAGGGVNTINARPFDAANTSPYGGKVESLPSTKGTESDELLSIRLPIPGANPITRDYQYEWTMDQQNAAEPIIFGAATSNGICVKNVGSAPTELDIEAEFFLTEWL